MQVIINARKRLFSNARELYTKLRPVARNDLVYAPVVALLAAIAAWELASHEIAKRIDNITLSWSPGALLFLWMVIGLATGAAVHIVFWVALTRYRLRFHREQSYERATFHSREDDRRRSHEIAPHFFGVVGVIYAVLVAFVVVTAWQVRARAEDLMIDEQHSVDYLFHLNGGLGTPRANVIQFLLRDYAVYTLAEWGQMQRGELICGDISAEDVSCFGSLGAVSKRTNLLAHCITTLTIALPVTDFKRDLYNPVTRQQDDALYRQSLRVLQEILQSRAERRLRYNERTLQPILWTAFLLGALLLAAMTYFVRGQSFGGQLLRTCALFGMVGMMTAIAVVFDRPFEGTTHVDGNAWAQMVTHLNGDLHYQPSPPHLLDACSTPGNLPVD